MTESLINTLCKQNRVVQFYLVNLFYARGFLTWTPQFPKVLIRFTMGICFRLLRLYEATNQFEAVLA